MSDVDEHAVRWITRRGTKDSRRRLREIIEFFLTAPHEHHIACLLGKRGRKPRKKYDEVNTGPKADIEEGRQMIEGRTFQNFRTSLA